MASLSLKVLPDSTTLRAGDTLTGRVEVRADQDVRCEALRLTLGWSTAGSGNPHEEPGAAEILFQGEWRGGSTHAYPFSVPIPNGPVSFEGGFVRVRWWLEAHAEVPWSTDHRERVPLEVRPALAALPQPFEFGPAFKDPAEQRSAPEGNVIAIGLLGVAVGCTFAAAAFTLFAGALKAIGAVGLVVAGVLAWKLVWPAINNTRARKVLGEIAITPEPWVCRPGAPVRVTVRVHPPGPLTLRGGQVTLEGSERAVYRDRENKQTVYEQDLHVQTVALTPLAGEAHTLQATLELPADAPPSFSAPWNHIQWKVKVELQPEGAPAWQGWQAIAVSG